MAIDFSIYDNADYSHIEEEEKDRSLGGNKGGDRRFYFMDEGTHIVRILPNVDDPNDFRKFISYHRDLFEHDKLLCVAATHEMKCPICEVTSSINFGKEKNPYRADRSYYSNAVIRNSEYGDLPVILRYTPVVFKWIFEKLTNPLYSLLFHPIRGIDIIITRTGQRLETKYDCSTHPDGRSPVFVTKKGEADLPRIEAAFNERYNLNEVFRKPDDEYIKMLTQEANLIKNKYSKKSVVNNVDLPAATEEKASPSPHGSEIPVCFKQHISDQHKCVICHVKDNCVFEVGEILEELIGDQDEVKLPISVLVRSFSNEKSPVDTPYVQNMLKYRFDGLDVKFDDNNVTLRRV